jgi:hypothetical protein
MHVCCTESGLRRRCETKVQSILVPAILGAIFEWDVMLFRTTPANFPAIHPDDMYSSSTILPSVNHGCRKGGYSGARTQAQAKEQLFHRVLYSLLPPIGFGKMNHGSIAVSNNSGFELSQKIK